jgi:TRAP-type C4-dicarboxylate transport system substrate-binding protein
MKRHFLAALAIGSLVTVGSAASAEQPSTAHIRIATLAPKESPWGKVFSAWANAIDHKTSGAIEVQWLWNGTAGPESTMVAKTRSGQIAGAAITAPGLASIHGPIIALQMPGAFKTWAALDRARDALKGDFDAAITKAGFYVSGWSDIGVRHTLSKGFSVVRPDDLRGKTPGYIANDLIAAKVFEAIGGITAKPAEVGEFLPMLSSGAINSLTAPSITAEQLQWASRLDHLNTGVVGFGVGAVVFSEAALAKLGAENREIVETTGRAANLALTRIIRIEDDQAFARLKKKMTVHDMTEAERAEWEKFWKKACQSAKTALPGDVLAKIGYC